MRIRKNSSKVLGSHSTHYWFMQPSSNSPKNSTEKLPSLSAPIKCEMNFSPWDVLHSVTEQLPDLSYNENEDAKTLDLMENGKKTIEEEPMTVLESASNGSSSLCASKKMRKKKKVQEEKKSTEVMEKDQMAHQRAKRRNSGSRMKVASDFYYFSTAGSWWGRMRKGPKRSRVAVKGTSGKEKDDENVANGVAGHDDDELSGGEESKSNEVIRSYERKPVEGLPIKFF